MPEQFRESGQNTCRRRAAGNWRKWPPAKATGGVTRKGEDHLDPPLILITHASGTFRGQLKGWLSAPDVNPNPRTSLAANYAALRKRERDAKHFTSTNRNLLLLCDLLPIANDCGAKGVDVIATARKVWRDERARFRKARRGPAVNQQLGPGGKRDDDGSRSFRLACLRRRHHFRHLLLDHRGRRWRSHDHATSATGPTSATGRRSANANGSRRATASGSLTMAAVTAVPKQTMAPVAAIASSGTSRRTFAAMATPMAEIRNLGATRERHHQHNTVHVIHLLQNIGKLTHAL
jgi:hypothetical protein